eukprot:12176-Heterococcus_DN1.PRE.2
MKHIASIVLKSAHSSMTATTVNAYTDKCKPVINGNQAGGQTPKALRTTSVLDCNFVNVSSYTCKISQFTQAGSYADAFNDYSQLTPVRVMV